VFAVVAPLGSEAQESREVQKPQAPAAGELLDLAFRNLYAHDHIQVIRLETMSGSGRSMSRRIQVTRKQSSRPGKALLRFLDPFDVRRTSILLLENDEGSDDLYVYLPATGITKHLSSAQKGDSFFGTDLAYEDLEPKYAKDYSATYQSGGSENDRGCKLVVAIPKASAASSYEMMVSCIEPLWGVITWTDFYRRNRVVKRLEINSESVREVDSHRIAFEMSVESLSRGTKTSVVTERYESRPAIPDRLFSTWNLQAGDAARDRSRSVGQGSTPLE
jgi:hypothetical protein